MAVAVDNKQEVVGVLTGSDMVKLVSEKKTIMPNEQTGSVMNRNVVGVELSETISDLVLKLSMKPVRDVVVTDGGKYVGVIDRQKLAERVEELLGQVLQIQQHQDSHRRTARQEGQNQRCKRIP
jgi:predicted transcriptional regulator